MLPGSLHLGRGGKRPNQDALGIRHLGFERSLNHSSGPAGDGMSQFLPQNRRVDAQLLCDLVGEFVTHNPARHALNVRQKIVDGLYLAFRAADRELTPGTLDQVVEIALRMLQVVGIGIFALAPDEEIRVKSGLKRKYLDLKFFFDQQAEGALGGFCARSVRIEIHNDILAEAS